MSYPGGKGSTFRTIINLMPPHRVYCEPFLGGGSVMLAKRPAVMNIGIDRDRQVIRTWNDLVTSAKIRMAPGSAHVSAEPGISDDSRRRPSVKLAMRAAPDWLSRSIILKCGDGIRYLEKARWGTGDLVYCDPPYLMEPRSSGSLYNYEMNSSEHQRLLRWAIAAPCMVMISGYWSEMYADELSKWYLTRYQASTRGGVTEECLWCNFLPPAELHDYRYLGENFRERERIRGMQQRWNRRLHKLPRLERLALLSMLAGPFRTVEETSR